MDCRNYQYSFFEFILPSTDLFRKLCLSYDKTRLFIMSFMRFAIYLYILNYVYAFYNDKKTDTSKNILIITAFLTGLNFLYLLGICVKRPVNND
uniref:Uncharacterized protein n=1 Tax=viral metagenome TaxID=1070528 RepID=A0A6C0EAN9_9ZZZZ